jgi:hypothetical protein
MTRLWPAGEAITVTADEQGRPLAFTWHGRSQQVVEITRRWRVDLGWWRRRRWRAYYKLRSDGGLLLIVYQDLDGGGWYVQRLYD